MKNTLSIIMNFFLDMLAFIAEIFGSSPTNRGDRFLRDGDGNSDLIGVVVPVSEDVTAANGKVRHSGIDWNARLEEDSSVETIESGTRAKIVAVDGNVLIISCES